MTQRWMTVLWILYVATLFLPGHCDTDLGSYRASVCREGTANITWTPPGGSRDYNFIDLYYTRKPENGKVYPRITVINWIPNRGWQVIWNPKRFLGRLRALSNSPTTSFVLENVVRIDNGEYELSAVTVNEGTFHGMFTLTVYHEDNYFPKLITVDNSTDHDDNTYTYPWWKTSQSPIEGVTMKPNTDGKQLRSETCYFDSKDMCVVVFTQEDLNVVGNVNFDVHYLFPENFSQCDTLDIPPTNLVIGIMAGIIVACLAIIVAVCVLVPLILRQRQKNKYALSLHEYLEITRKCIDGIQNIQEVTELRGVYRINTRESVIKAYFTEFKKKMEQPIKNCCPNIFKNRFQIMAVIWRIVENLRFLPDENTLWTLRHPANKHAQIISNGQRNRIQRFNGRIAQPGRVRDAQLVDLNGLATCVAPNFFQKVKDPDQNMPQRWTGFVVYVINNVDQVFPIEENPLDGANTTVSQDLAQFLNSFLEMGEVCETVNRQPSRGMDSRRTFVFGCRSPDDPRQETENSELILLG
ncbi:hypothetical protein LSH36_281g04012 [Paralvinella palmiformis]|uniref:Uncharacterized protein n=1 Tax=Paralvinella palmiformis TaxID=53620 RepID=A0AAD9N4F2_9ANNE|nr:hypothetical protein LSH36_281g04012 [Paralvinella palmiformis]